MSNYPKNSDLSLPIICVGMSIYIFLDGNGTNHTTSGQRKVANFLIFDGTQLTRAIVETQIVGCATWLVVIAITQHSSCVAAFNVAKISEIMSASVLICAQVM